MSSMNRQGISGKPSSREASRRRSPAIRLKPLSMMMGFNTPCTLILSNRPSTLTTVRCRFWRSTLMSAMLSESKIALSVVRGQPMYAENKPPVHQRTSTFQSLLCSLRQTLFPFSHRSWIRVIRRLPSSPSSGQRAEAGYERSSLGTGALWIFLLLVPDMSVS